MVGRPRAFAAVGFALLLVVSGFPLPGALASDALASRPAPDERAGPSPAADRSGALAVQAGPRQADNETRQHDNPANVSEAGDLLDVRGWLSNRMLDRLSTGAVQLDQGQYERARSLVGDEFGSRLGQYVDVVGETETESDDDSDDPYRTTRRAQRNLTETVRAYDETFEDYEEAVEADNETAAREHARRLQRLASDVRRLNRTAIGGYQRLENQTGTDLDRATTSIETVAENVTERQQDVDMALFTETELAVSPASASIAYTDPLRASGRLTTAAGEPVADRAVRIRVAGRTHTVQTDDSGAFQLVYRPRTVRVDRSSLAVSYVPADTAPYLAANDSVAVDIEQVTADLTVEEATGTAAFGDRVGATARLAVDDRPVQGIPVRAAIGDTALGQTPSGEDGLASVNGSLPATVPAGDRSLSLTAGTNRSAVTADPATRTVRVQSTATNLTVTADQPTAQIAVSGRLATVGGRPASGRAVEVAVADAVTETVRTGPEGAYTVAVDAGALGLADNETVTVRAQFDGEGTNLGGAAATTRLTYRNASAAGGANGGNGPLPGDLDPRDAPVSPLALGGLAALAVLFAVLLALRRRYAGDGDGSPDGPTPTPADDGPTEAANGGAEAGAAAGAATGLDFGPAESFLGRGDRAAAVRYTYQHLRSHVAPEVGAAESDTHWEFVERCRADGMSDARLDAVRDLVEAYEAVEFRPGAADPDAEALLAAVTDEWPTQSA
ncbi:hypothetical protein [Halosimplex halophilum]|uniref:hypothetical protein n=1 Tax=Halosimplex halophilum TaxID=2559572 RepID=UPI00107F0728|nr:hypothetical protein [Halosimplex halophilum]